MAEVRVVLVNGDVFAVCTTEPNAVMLRDKINKTYAGMPSELADTSALYNPKHIDALERLDGMGMRRMSAPVTTTRKTSGARGRGTRAA